GICRITIDQPCGEPGVFRFACHAREPAGEGRCKEGACGAEAGNDVGARTAYASDYGSPISGGDALVARLPRLTHVVIVANKRLGCLADLFDRPWANCQDAAAGMVGERDAVLELMAERCCKRSA